MKTIQEKGIFVDASPVYEKIPDESDMPFYEVVMEEKDNNTYLVTGNLKHFPSKEFILTPSQFIDLFEKSIDYEIINEIGIL